MWTANRYTKLATWDQARSAILDLVNEPDPSLELVNDTGARFFVGIKDDQAFVIYNPTSRSPAVSASLDPAFKPRTDADYVYFTVGETQTPIPKDRCIPLQTLLRILEEYWKDERLSSVVSWRRE